MPGPASKHKGPRKEPGTDLEIFTELTGNSNLKGSVEKDGGKFAETKMFDLRY